MNQSRLLKRIMDEADLNQYEIAELIGVSQGTVSRWASGADMRGSHRDSLIQLAKDKGLITTADIVMVPVVGKVGADPSGVILYAEGQGTSDMALLPPGADQTCVAVEVAGHSMGLRAPDGSLIFYADTRSAPDNDMLGHLVIVGIDTGEVLVKRLLRGSHDGVFDLESVVGDIRHDVRVRWAAHIMSIVPPYQAQKIIIRNHV